MNITLKTLHEATEQQVFDQVARHLLTQNEKAISDNRRCRYRLETVEGTILKCAVGCLISDDEYTPKMEGLAYGMPGFNKAVGDWFKPTHSNLLSDLQSMHDASPSSEWKEKLRETAKGYNLNADILKEQKMTTINYGADYLNPSELLERLEELREMDRKELDTEELEELGILDDSEEALREAEENGGQLIHETNFENYCQELCEECETCLEDVPWYIVIDWEATADNMRIDYSTIEIYGDTYLYR